MASEVVMPRLSDSMEEGTVLSWLKSVGDEVAVGDELVEIETDKANMVYEADAAGTLTEIIADEGATLPIGEVIAKIGDAAEVDASDGDGDSSGEKERESDEERRESASEGTGEAEADGSSDGPAEPAPEPASAAPATRDDGERIKASPLARRMAGDQGLELSAIDGSGPGGRIVKADVEKAVASGGADAASEPVAEAPASSAPEDAKPTAPATPGAREKAETARGTTETVELTKLQQTVARRMAESKATAPHFYLNTEVDMTRAVAGRAALKAGAKEGDVVPSFNDMVVKACALALREFPRANGAYKNGKVEEYSRVNVGVAVAAQDALVVPTVFDADVKGLGQIATETRALAARVREGTITPPELSGGTFTVSNLGMFGVTSFSAVVNPPQAGILAVGSIEDAPVVRDGEIVPGQRMAINLACDHRILYGADGAKFLARVRELLTEPLALAL